jgi:YgiT-type zinc finger domain-containing protein
MKIINCGTCGGTAMESTTTDITKLEKCKIVIDNVPCYECNDCGEIMYIDNVVGTWKK